MTQRELADLVRAEIYNASGKESVITAKSISDWECGMYTWPPAHVRRALCRVLEKADPADLGFFNSRRVSEARVSSTVSLLDLMAGRLPPAGANTLYVPGGQSFSGVDVEAHLREAASSGEGWLMVDAGPDGVLNRPDRRSLVVVVDGKQQSYILDGRRFAGRVGGRTGLQPVSSAVAVDDLTVGIIWAVTNTDVALLADDSQISTVQSGLEPRDGHYVWDAPWTEMPTLTPVAVHWLRSWFCTQYSTRNLERMLGQPCFWTQGRSGEDVTSWLLWRHRFEYLRLSSRWFPGLRCDFYVSNVSNSPLYERVLLLLAVALMEGFGIAATLNAESERSEAERTVSADESMVLNRIGGCGLCCADASASRSCRGALCDVADPEHGPSSVTEQSSKRRLETIANHLDVPWPWFQQRCAELAVEGVDDVAHPRSRLLSTRGLNAAIRYVAHMKGS
ncbi:hypothetical protein AB0E69_17095 [Kribbella sp. NPDC026611]|uniref:hypothetical protein n=1 Tax=Kribbella sp. NPDC026611 TaxID=3154911 RepID=UPI0033F20819